MEELESNSYMLAQSIKYEIERNTFCRLTISLGSIRERIQGIAESIRDAEAVLNLNYIFGKNKIIGTKDTKLSKMNGKNLLKLEEGAVIECLRRGNKTDIYQLVSDYIKEIKYQGLSSFLYAHMFMSVNVAVVKFVEELGGQVESVVPELSNLGGIIVGIDSLESFRIYMGKILIKAFDFRESRKRDKYGNIIEKAKEFIGKEYHNSNISLNSVAAFINVSPSHFSTIFSQETGITFIEYLTNIRISKAKELLKSTSMRSSEIAFQVGYNDSHYFSHVFKKVTSLTPTKFRGNR